MCGICGEFRFDGQAPNQSVTLQMMSMLERRGPDREGSFFDESVALGHRRLSIIDLSEKSSQPMVDGDRNNVLVFNGTIYNYPELRAQLQKKGYTFNSTGDTEVLIKAYAEWGVECLQYLHGMFAFCIWDKSKKNIFIARDRMGVKPLYYSMNNKRIIFASTTQALLKADRDIDTNIDTNALHNILTLHAVVPAPGTVLKGVRKVRPAHYMVIHENGEVEEKRYWTLRSTRPSEPLTDEEWVELIHESLKKSVDRRIKIADVPVGVLLSGGIDSSLLVGLLSEAGVSDLKTFSVGFEGQPEESGDEFIYSDAVAQCFGTEHHRFTVKNSQVIPKLPEAFSNMSEPMFAQDAIAFYLLSEVVSKHVKVVQSGQGADEVFGGYFWYPKMHHSIRPGLPRFSEHYFDRHHSEYLETVNENYHGADITSRMMAELIRDVEADEYIDRVLNVDVTTLIVDDPVKRVDNMTMAFGLEARVPFLDQELVELAAKMPPHLKLQGGGKYVLKQISRGLLPDSVIDRPKGYFPMPALKYIRDEFLDFMREILLSKKARERGLYQSKYVNKLFNEPDKWMTPLNGNKLWHLCALELWLQMNV